MDEQAPNLQLQEPISPESLLPSTDYTLVWISAVVLLLLIAALFFFLSRKRKSGSDPISHRRAAYQVAKKAFDAANPPNAREAAVESSLILRRFLAQAVSDPSLFETHEEFISRQDALKKLTPVARDAASAGFSRLAQLKYAPEIPSDEPAVVVKESRDLLETLNGGFEP